MIQKSNLFNKRALAVIFLLFASGIVFAEHARIRFDFLVIPALISFILALLIRKKDSRLRLYVIGILIFLSGIAVYLNADTLPKNHISYLLKDSDKQYYIRGIIRSLPGYTWRRWGTRECRFIFQAKAYKEGNNWLSLSGLCRAEIDDNELEYSYGDNIVVSAEVKKPYSFGKNKGFDYAKYLQRKNIYTIVDIRNDDDVSIIAKERGFCVRRFIHSLRREVESRFKRFLPYPDNSILSAMLIARRHSLPKEIKGLFARTGTMHIISVSGLHVAIISGILFFLLNRLFVPRKISSALVIIFLALYVVMGEERAPILRAAIMITVYLLSYILERDFDIYTALSLAGIIILLINPMQIFTAGFVLSFACVFSIFYITPRLESMFNRYSNLLFKRSVIASLPQADAAIPTPEIASSAQFTLNEVEGPPRNDKLKFQTIIIQYIKKLLCASTAVFIGVWPIVALYFNIISPVSIIANIIVVPLLGIILFSGILFSCIPISLKILVFFFSRLVHMLFVVLLKSLEFLEAVPWAYFHISSVSLYLFIIYYILLYIVLKRFSNHNIE